MLVNTVLRDLIRVFIACDVDSTVGGVEEKNENVQKPRKMEKWKKEENVIRDKDQAEGESRELWGMLHIEEAVVLLGKQAALWISIGCRIIVI